jgi:hypothetical protein
MLEPAALSFFPPAAVGHAAQLLAGQAVEPFHVLDGHDPEAGLDILGPERGRAGLDQVDRRGLPSSSRPASRSPARAATTTAATTVAASRRGAGRPTARLFAEIGLRSRRRAVTRAGSADDL